jgi:lipopolysaccharide transport system ATP-binding protein
MGEVAKEGRTVLFVSHNMAAIVNLCNKAMLLDGGRKLLWGEAADVVANYLRSVAAHAEVKWMDDSVRPGDTTIKLHAVRIVDREGRVVDTVGLETEFYVEMEYEIRKPIRGLQVGFRLATSDGTVVFTSGDTDNRPDEETDRQPGYYLARCMIPGGLLSPQTYYFSFGAHVPNVHTHFFVEDVLTLTVVRTQPRGSIVDDKRQGIICPVLHWQVSRITGGEVL